MRGGVPVLNRLSVSPASLRDSESAEAGMRPSGPAGYDVCPTKIRLSRKVPVQITAASHFQTSPIEVTTPVTRRFPSAVSSVRRRVTSAWSGWR